MHAYMHVSPLCLTHQPLRWALAAQAAGGRAVCSTHAPSPPSRGSAWCPSATGATEQTDGQNRTQLVLPRPELRANRTRAPDGNAWRGGEDVSGHTSAGWAPTCWAPSLKQRLARSGTSMGGATLMAVRVSGLPLLPARRCHASGQPALRLGP